VKVVKALASSLKDKKQEKKWVRITKARMGLYTFAERRLTEIYVKVKPVDDDVSCRPNHTLKPEYLNRDLR
jgi:hypothetical protein